MDLQEQKRYKRGKQKEHEKCLKANQFEIAEAI